MSRETRIGLAVSVVAALGWLAFGLANGPATGNDTFSYQRVADAFANGRIVTSMRPPGYPLFLVACRGLASLLGAPTEVVVLVMQTLLLSGVATFLVYRLGCALTGGVTAGVVAATLFAVDPDVQQYGSTVLSEALTVSLVVVTLWLRIHDGHWWRAAWGLALLALVRPNYAPIPLAFALWDLARLRMPGVLIAAAGPTVLCLAVWYAVALGAGANPFRPQQWFVPLGVFGKVYDSGLWEKMPDGPMRQAVATERAKGSDPYHAVRALIARFGARGFRDLGLAAVRADPLGYAYQVSRVPKAAFRQSNFERHELYQPSHPRPALLAAMHVWHDVFRGVFYASFPLFLLLLAVACWNGLGWPNAIAPFREVAVPLVVLILGTTAIASLSTYDVGRIALGMRPVYCLAIGLGVAWGVERVRSRGIADS